MLEKLLDAGEVARSWLPCASYQLEIDKHFYESKILVHATNESCLSTCTRTWWALEVAVVEFFPLLIQRRRNQCLQGVACRL